MGIEPTLSAWKAEVLPLNYTRAIAAYAGATRHSQPLHLPALTPSSMSRPRVQAWWRGEDSNLRRQSRQIYSLIPLAAREPLPKRKPRIMRDKTPGRQRLTPQKTA